MQRGSLTLYAAMTIMLVASVLLALLESARVQMVSRCAQHTLDAALESVFAQYDGEIWDQYHLLLCEMGETESTLSFQKVQQIIGEISGADLLPSRVQKYGKSSHLLQAELSDLQIEDYTLVTDGDGQVFESLVASFMKNTIGFEAAKELQERYRQGSRLEEEDIDSAMQTAEDGIRDAGKEAKEQGKTGIDAPQEVSDNPLKVVAQLKKMGILSLVVENVDEISEKQLDLRRVVSHRNLQKGPRQEVSDQSWYEQLLVQQYYLMFFSDYQEPNPEGGLSYELEYLLGGKSSDRENLKVCVSKLLLARESCNLLYLFSDAGKLQETLSLAGLLAGASANPLIIQAVQFALLVAWAFVESILDLRTLMSGGRIALMKTESLWTSDLSGLSQCTEGKLRAKESEKGFSYKDYLSILIYSGIEHRMAMRAMDLQEATVRKIPGYENFCMDHMITELTVTGTYRVSPLFLPLAVIGTWGGDQLELRKKSRYCYIENVGEGD